MGRVVIKQKQVSVRSMKTCGRNAIVGVKMQMYLITEGTSQWHLGNRAHRGEASDGLRLMVALVLVWKRSVGQAH